MDEIRIANKEDIPGIRQIWYDVFTTDPLYLSLIFKDLYPQIDAFVYQRDQQIISVAFAIPITASIPYNSLQKSTSQSTHNTNSLLKGRYLYGVATKATARGEGLSKKVVKKIQEYYRKKDEKFIIVRPAEETLFDFYRKQGFNKPLTRLETTLHLETAPSTTLCATPLCFPRKPLPLSPIALYKMRTALFTSNYFVWSPGILKCILNFIYKEGDIANSYQFQGDKKYLIAHPDYQSQNTTKNIIVEETSLFHVQANTVTTEKTPQNKEGTAQNTVKQLQQIIYAAREFSPSVQNITIYSPVLYSPEKCIKRYLKTNSKETASCKNEIRDYSIKKEVFALIMPLDPSFTAAFNNTFFNFTME